MKKKKGEVFKNISNKLAYTLIVVLSLALLGIGVYATTYTASGAGHPYTEISTCPSNGQILKMSGGSWVCATPSAGGGFVPFAASGMYSNRYVLPASPTPSDTNIDANNYGVPAGATAVLISAELYRVCPSASNRYGHVVFRPTGSGTLINVLRSGNPLCQSSWDWYTYGEYVIPLDSNGQFQLSFGSGSGTTADWFNGLTIYWEGYYM